MKVEKVVGWYQGLSGTGNVFELSHGNRFLLATIWSDGKFHRMTVEDLVSAKKKGTASFDGEPSRYPDHNIFTEGTNGALPVENPIGWERFYAAPDPESETPEDETGSETSTEDELVFPISVSFTGQIKINVAGISKILKFIE